MNQKTKRDGTGVSVENYANRNRGQAQKARQTQKTGQEATFCIKVDERGR